MADDFVFKISLPGVDVETARPEDCAVHSAYDTLKLKLDNQNPHFGRVDVTFNTNPSPSTTLPVLTIDHGYDYTPFYYFFYSVKDSTKPVSTDIGRRFDNDAFGDLSFIARPRSKKIDFQVEVSSGYGDNVTGNTYSFRYYVFANDGV